MGDLVDRGDDELPLLQYIATLKTQAALAGGAVHALLGNHELLNIFGSFAYVTPAGFRAFDSFDISAEGSPVAGRTAAFAPGGPIARMLAANPIAVVVADTLFVHAGLELQYATMGLSALNAMASNFLAGNQSRAEEVAELLMTEESPLWTRKFSLHNPTPAACAELQSVLELVGAKRMVVGHTVQDRGISTACDERVWRIDVGFSSAYRQATGSRVEILHLINNRAYVLAEAVPSRP